jgi:hypothetical protein
MRTWIVAVGIPYFARASACCARFTKPGSFVAALAIAALASGCGPSCQSTCTRLWRTADGSCGLVRAGISSDDGYKECVDMCENALEQTGAIGGYDPDERHTDGTTITIDNERQAAAWMDCVDETACEKINEGYCEPWL